MKTTRQVLRTKKNWRPFEEARAFARSLGLRKWSEWNRWAKSDGKPKDIPADPRWAYKNSGWISAGDWLGTGRVANQDRAFLPFEKARSFVHSLALKNRDEWKIWSKSNARPHSIPTNPNTAYKTKGWQSWGDWLGTGRIANQKKKYLPFNEARAIARALVLKSQSEWNAWAKKGTKPDNLPAYPDAVYKHKGWSSWGDWLGTGNIAPSEHSYLPFEEARTFVWRLGLENDAEWREWTRSNERPNNIPAAPWRTYRTEGWKGLGDWLGTGRRANQDRTYLPYEEARVFVNALGLENKESWAKWAKTQDRPDYIPVSPGRVYKNQGWKSWGEWLGTGRVANQNRVYLSFKEARAFTHGLGLKNRTEWDVWAKTDHKRTDIPAYPDAVYRSSGWAGWGDWLGVVNLWNRNAILSLLKSIEPVISSLQPAELYSIMRQNGMVTSISYGNKNATLLRSIQDLCSSLHPEPDFEKLVAEIEKQNESLDTDELANDEAITPDVIAPEGETRQELPTLRSLSALKAVDMLVDVGITSDKETIEFLVENRVSGLWQAALNNDPAFDLDHLRAENGGAYFNTIRSRFLEQYDGAQSLPIPSGYSFQVEGALAPPNLMQRLTAYRVLTEQRLGNWSGVGAGKTLSAILASRVADARLTLIVAFNSTLDAWETRIREVYPDSVIHKKQRGSIRVDRDQHTYFILNFEAFQQPDSAAFARRLVEQHQIDFIVLDEIQSVKQRAAKVESKRRQVLNGLLSAASEKNPNLRVLGMSATPVINNLYEARALLEMIKGVQFDDLKTFPSIANASAMHEKLILYGIRYRPQYSQTIDTTFVEIDGESYLPRLLEASKGGILKTERVLLDAKMETLLAHLRQGTLIYTHYLTGLIAPLRRAIERAGLKVGLFTGEDKSGLKPFIEKKVDVLIGSIPVGTGVDGLQYVCNRLIVVSLPWTSAEYEQLIGRLYRQGSAFDKVEVILPQVVLERDGEMWSWDKMRMNRIQYKKTLADAALDGVIPEGELASPETMYKKAHEALQAWIQRVEQAGVTTIDRAKLRVPLPEEETRIARRRFGDLSVMNARINSAYSATTHERLTQQPEEWYLYHTVYRQARETWTEIPYERIARSLEKRPDWIVGDFGCGEALLAAMLPNKVYSFDHVAINESVIACDMAHTPLEDATLDVAVISLSLMGLNYADYLREAYRAVKYGGLLKIAEPASRWVDKRGELISAITNAGFVLIGEVEESGQFLYISAIKGLV